MLCHDGASDYLCWCHQESRILSKEKQNQKSRLYVKLGIYKFELATSMIALHIFSGYLVLHIIGGHISLVTKLCPNLIIPWTVAPRLLCPRNFPGKNTGVGYHCLLQGIFLTQGSNPHLLHCRWILYRWANKDSYMKN